MDNLIDHKTLVELCAKLYDPTKNEEWDKVFEISDVHVAYSKVNDVDIVVFRGSVDVHDWLDDMNSVPIWDNRLGFVHAGFISGLSAVLEVLNPLLGANVVVTGHSLGGARARLFSALRICLDLPISQVTVFGSPRPAFGNVSRILQKSNAGHSSYRNRNDPVPLFPILLPLWEHTEKWILLNEHPEIDDFNPLRDHCSSLYVRGISNLLTNSKEEVQCSNLER